MIMLARSTIERRVTRAPSSVRVTICVAGARHCAMPSQTR